MCFSQSFIFGAVLPFLLCMSGKIFQPQNRIKGKKEQIIRRTPLRETGCRHFEEPLKN